MANQKHTKATRETTGWDYTRDASNHLVLTYDGRPTVKLNRAKGCDTLNSGVEFESFARQVSRALDDYEAPAVDNIAYDSPNLVDFTWLPICVYVSTMVGMALGVMA